MLIHFVGLNSQIRNKSYINLMKLIAFLILLSIALACPNNCNDCDQTGIVCFACAEGFELIVFGLCVDSATVFKCTMYGPTNQCFSCQATFSTINNEKCIKDYTACLAFDPYDDSTCITCGFGTILKDNRCTGPINCAATIAGSCTSCVTGFTLDKGICIDNTGDCETVGSNGVCETCKTGFNLVGYTCLNSTQKVYGCYIFDSTGTCQLCKAGYDLYQGSCLIPSQIQQIQRGTKMLACPKNCNDCNSKATICFACTEGFELNVLGLCVDSATVSKCILYGSSNQCFSCQATYTINNGHCLKNYTSCLVTHPAYYSKCITCGFGTILKDNRCTGPINCAATIAGSCTSCVTGFTLDKGICIDNTGDCETVGSNGVCETCKTGFNLVGYTCLNSTQKVYGCYIFDSTGTCQLCKAGYDLYQGSCLIPSQIQQIQRGAIQLSIILSQRNNSFGSTTSTITIVNCEIYDPSNPALCLGCIAGYYTTGAVCIQVSIFCATYNPVTGACLSCKYDFSLQNGQCNDTNCLAQTAAGCTTCRANFALNANYCQLNDSNCVQAATTICLLCASGYFVGNAGICMILPPNCIAVNPSTFTCTKCANGFQLTHAGNCTQSSSTITTTNLVSEGTGESSRSNGNSGNNESSGNSDSYGSSSNSSSFQANETFPLNSSSSLGPGSGSGGVVVISRESSTSGVTNRDPNCSRYNGTICAQCSNRYYFDSNSLCVQVNSLCNNYSSNGDCLSCYPAYVLQNGKCIIPGLIQTGRHHK